MRVARVTAKVMFVRAKRDKWGWRGHYREFEYAQIGIQKCYPDAPPRGVPKKRLTYEANRWLQTNDPEFRAAGFSISERTVKRALAYLIKRYRLDGTYGECTLEIK